MIICAAIKIQMNNLEHPTVVPCFRHGDGFKIIKDLVQDRSAFKEIAQGFINHNGEFLGRTEAFLHAQEIGQCNATQRYYWENHKQDELYSEDLY